MAVEPPGHPVAARSLILPVVAAAAGFLAAVAIGPREPERPFHELRGVRVGIAFAFFTLAPVVSPDQAFGLFLASQSCLLTFLVVNRHISGGLWVAAGVVFNALPVAINKGMPVSASAAHIAGVTPPSGAARHLVMGDATHLNFLGDILPIPYIGKVISLGDVLMLFGFAIVAYTVTAQSKKGSTKQGIQPVQRATTIALHDRSLSRLWE